MWPIAATRIVVGLIIAQLTTIGVLSLKVGCRPTMRACALASHSVLISFLSCFALLFLCALTSTSFPSLALHKYTRTRSTLLCLSVGFGASVRLVSVAGGHRGVPAVHGRVVVPPLHSTAVGDRMRCRPSTTHGYACRRCVCAWCVRSRDLVCAGWTVEDKDIEVARRVTLDEVR